MPTNTPGTDRQPRRRRLTASQRRIWPTADGTPDFDFTYPEERRVAIAGDWESNLDAVHAILHTLTNTAPDLRTILHLGDLRYEAPVLVGGKQVFPRNTIVRLDALLDEFGIRRLLLTPGNHGWPEQLHAEFTRHPDRPYRISERIWVLPRGFRFQLGTTTFLSFGGAASLDKGPGDRGWSMHEAPTVDDVDHASAAGMTDVLLTHEAPDVHIREVDDIIRARSTWPAARLRASATSRALVTDLLRAVAPTHAFHGHMHVAGETHHDGTSTYSLAVAGKPHNVGILDVHNPHFTWLENARGAATNAIAHPVQPPPAPTPGPSAPRTELTDADRGRWLVTTMRSTYLIDLDRRSITRIPGPDASPSINDVERPLMTIRSCVVGEHGHFRMRSDDIALDYFWQISGVIRAIRTTD